MTPQGSPPGAADEAVRLAGFVLDTPGAYPGSAIRMAEWIVRWSDTVAAAKAQELVAFRMAMTDTQQAVAGMALISRSNHVMACRATEQAVRAALPRDEKEGG